VTVAWHLLLLLQACQASDKRYLYPCELAGIICQMLRNLPKGPEIETD
jgi:hypothetical protein